MTKEYLRLNQSCMHLLTNKVIENVLLLIMPFSFCYLISRLLLERTYNSNPLLISVKAVTLLVILANYF